MKRPCIVCGRLSQWSRCPEHERPSAWRRGYDTRHRAARLVLADRLPAYCWYGCGRLLTENDPWVAAHVRDGDPSSPRVISCRPCNEAAKIK